MLANFDSSCIHKFRMHGVNIVLDINSGYVHEVADIIMDLLYFFEEYGEQVVIQKLTEKYSLQMMSDAFRDIDELISSGRLFAPDRYAGHVFNFKRVTKALCLNVTGHCNLSCKYCFASGGSYNRNKVMMSSEIGRKAIDFVIKASGQRRNIEIDFFGGEPLMNLRLIKDVIGYARSKEREYNKNFRFTLTTNGVLLNKCNINYINENMSNIVLSIDGTPETNDFMRQFINGTGSYHKIIDNFLKLADLRKQNNYYVRGTFTRNNLNFSKDVLHLADVGFKQISVEPVVSDPSKDFAILESDLPQIFAEYEILALQYVKRKKAKNGFNFFHFMIDMKGGPCIIKRLSGCGAGCDYLSIDPEGGIYPCHQFIGIDRYFMGNVITNEPNREIFEEFSNCSINTKGCSKCFAKLYCSGGCHANSFVYGGSINTPYAISCALMKKRIECALYAQSQL